MKFVRSDRVAFIDRGIELTHGDAISRIEQISEVIKSKKIKKDSKIAIVMENSSDWIFSFYGIWHADCVAVVLDYMAPKEEIMNLIKDNGDIAMLIYSNKTKEKLKVSSKDINVDDLSLPKESSSKILDFSKHDNLKGLGAILYTSGTSGNPVGVMLSRLNFISNTKDIASTNAVAKNETFYTFAPMFHSTGLIANVFVAIYMETKLIISDIISPEEIFNTLVKYRVNLFGVIPKFLYLVHKKVMIKINSSFLSRLTFKFAALIGSKSLSRLLFKKVHDRFGSSLKYMACGGAPLDPKIERDFATLGITILSGYGLTEASPTVSVANRDNIKIGSVGKILNSIEAKIVDGELVVKGPNIFMGYYKNPEKTKETLIDGWLYTGDLAEISNDFLYIKGRKKEVIVLPNGKNIWPHKVEDRLIKCIPIIEEVAVYEDKGVLSAIVKVDQKRAEQSKVTNILYHIKDKVSDYNIDVQDYERVKDIKITNSELPKTRIGKIKRYLLSKLKEEKVVKNEPDLPQKEYRELKFFFKQNFGKEISPSDHIELDLQLESLDKLELLDYIKRKFKISILIEEISKNPMLKSLTNLIISKKRDNENRLNKEQIKNRNSEKEPTLETEELNTENKNQENNQKNQKDQNSSLAKKSNSLPLVMRLFHAFIRRNNRLIVNGIDNIPKEPVLFISNHLSIADWYLISAALKDRATSTLCLAKDKLISGFLSNFIFSNSNLIIFNVDNNVNYALKKIVDKIHSGKSVLIFPEGTRSRDGTLQEFKETFAKIARDNSIPIIPIAIQGSFEMLPPGSYFPKKADVSISFGNPILPNGNIEDIAKETKESIISMLEQM